MRIVPMFVLVLASFAAPVSATETTGPMTAVHQFVDGLNENHISSALAACASESSIVDEFPPYAWHGSGACTRWVADFGADAKKNGITEPSVKLGTPKHVDVTATNAYVVAPATYAFKVRGKPVTERNATITFALAKTSGWHIVSFTWSKP